MRKVRFIDKGSKFGSKISKSVLLVVAFSVLGAGLAVAQQDKVEIVIDGSLHTAAEIMVILVDSKVSYQIMTGEADSIPVDTTAPQILPAGIFLGENYEFQMHVLPDSLKGTFDKAEISYQSKDYNAAAILYKEVFSKAPDYIHLLTFIGDAYNMAGEFDSAMVYLQQSIDRNFIDYQAHWYLSNAYVHSGRSDESLRQIHLAHLLNPNHELMRGNLTMRREENNLPPLEDNFKPKYDVRQEDDKILLRYDPMWLQYALVKMIWLAEPGYRDQMLIGLTHPVEVVILEEKEAVFNHLSREARRELRAQLIVDDLYVEFVIYEFLAYKMPELMLYLSPDILNGIADYLMVRHEYLALVQQ